MIRACDRAAATTMASCAQSHLARHACVDLRKVCLEQELLRATNESIASLDWLSLASDNGRQRLPRQQGARAQGVRRVFFSSTMDSALPSSPSSICQ